MTPFSPLCTHELLTQRLALLRALADSLEQAQSALATITPGKLDQQTARQKEICRELSELSAEVTDESQIPAQAKLADDMQQTARQVLRLNRLYGALLRRRRRTVDIFCRVLASSGTTYPPPQPPLRADLEKERPKG